MKRSIHEDQIEPIQSHGHWRKPRVRKETFHISTRFEVGVSGFDRRNYPETKTHEDEEALYIIKSEGHARLDDDEVKPTPGTLLYVPARTLHCIKRTSKGPLKAVCCHSGHIEQ